MCVFVGEPAPLDGGVVEVCPEVVDVLAGYADCLVDEGLLSALSEG